MQNINMFIYMIGYNQPSMFAGKSVDLLHKNEPSIRPMGPDSFSRKAWLERLEAEHSNYRRRRLFLLIRDPF